MNRWVARSRRLLTLLVLCALPARALDLVPLSIDQLIANSPRIVIATCVSSETRPVKASGDNPFTFTRFNKVEKLAGDLAGSFEVRLFGGQIGNVRVWEDGLPSFAPGSRYLLFLGPSNAEGFPLLKPQGIFEILKPEAGKTAERLRSTLGDQPSEHTLAQVRERIRARAPAAGSAKKTSNRTHEPKGRIRGPRTAADRQLHAP